MRLKTGFIILFCSCLYTPRLFSTSDTLLSYFPFEVGNIWQYTTINTDYPPIHGSADTIEIRITRVDTTASGGIFVYTNDLTEPRWYIDSLYVYSLPLNLRHIPLTGAETWWTLEDSTLNPPASWRRSVNMTSELFDYQISSVKFEQYRSTSRGDTVYSYKEQHEIYAYGIGLIEAYLSSSAYWRLTGCIINGDTLGSIKDTGQESVLSWFPVEVGNVWQYRNTERVDFGPWHISYYSNLVTGIDTLPDNIMLVHINDTPRWKIDIGAGTVYDHGTHRMIFRYADMLQVYPLTEDDPYQTGRLLNVEKQMRWGERRHRLYLEIFDACNDSRRWFAEGLGFIGTEINVWGYSTDLVGAILGGITYGTVSVKPTKDVHPTVYQLFQNYPNPFNPVTKIRYSVSRTTEVSLTIYDILGKKIVELVNGETTPGVHEVVFDASGLPGGVYFYRLHADGYSATARLVLVR